jgi:hypothetical protein
MGFLEFVLWLLFFKVLFDLVVRPYKNAKTEIEEQLVEKISEVTHIVSVEQHGEQIYWFDADTGNFIAQGKTLEDIIYVVKSRFPTHYFFLNNNHLLHGPEWRLRKIDVDN